MSTDCEVKLYLAPLLPIAGFYSSLSLNSYNPLKFKLLNLTHKFAT